MDNSAEAGRKKSRRPVAADHVAGKAAGTQAIQRASLLLRVIATGSRSGLRLADIVRESGLEHATAHRILKGLTGEGLVMQDVPTRRYFLGPLVFELGLAAASKFNLCDLCRPALQRVAEQTGDTVFLAVRSGLDSVCIDRLEGSFPIKTLTLDVGTRRPLGAGAGGIALLMRLSDEAIGEIIAANAARLGERNLTASAALKNVQRSQELGYALNDRHDTVGVTTLGLPIVNRYGHPYAAVSIGAISSRMKEERQKELASFLRTAIRQIEKAQGELG